MTASAPAPSLIRRKRFYANTWMAVIPRRTVYRSRMVVTNPAPDPVTYIYPTGLPTIGSIADIEPDMEVVYYHQDTNIIKGRGRVAHRAAADTVRINVNEFSIGTVDIRDDDYFEVVDYWALTDKLVSATDEFLKDTTWEYTDELEDFWPIANAGGPYPMWIDPDTGLARAEFSTATSIAVGGGSMTPLWDFGDGTIVSGDVDQNEVVVDFDPADDWFRNVKLTMTSSVSGKSRTKRIPTWSFSPDMKPYRVELLRFNATIEDGWSFTIRVPIDMGIDLLPHGSMVVLFGNHFYNGQKGFYGTEIASRDHVDFVGYLNSESITIDATGDTLTFECISPIKMGTQLRALPQYVEDVSNPDTWQEIVDLTFNKMFWYIAEFQSSALNVLDLLWINGLDSIYPAVEITNTPNLTEQFRNVAGSVAALFTSDRLGRFIARRDVMLASNTERNSRQVIWDFTLADAVSIGWEQPHNLEVGLVEGGGFDYSGEPMLAEAPGSAPGSAPGFDNIGNWVFADQNELNRLTGHLYAKRNGTYWDSATGVIKKVPQNLSMKVKGGYRFIDPCLMPLVTFDLPADSNKRGTEFDEARFAIRSMTGQIGDNGKTDITLSLNHETKGPDGVYKEVPEEPENDWRPPLNDGVFPLPTIDTFPVLLPPPYSYTTEGIGVNALLAFGASGGAARAFSTDGFQTIDTLSMWEDISSGLTGQVTWAHVDPFVFDDFFSTSYDGLFKGVPKAPTFAGWSQIADNNDIFGDPSYVAQDFNLSINEHGRGTFISGYLLSHVQNLHTTPVFTVDTTFASTGSTAMGSSRLDIAYSPYGGGRIYCVRSIFTGAVFDMRIFRSENWGASWTDVSGNIGNFAYGELYVPSIKSTGAQNTNANQEVYLFCAQNSSRYLMKSVNSGVTFSQSFIDSVANYTNGYFGRSFIVVDDNPNIVYMNKIVGAGLNPVFTYYTVDGGASFADVESSSINFRPIFNYGHNPQNRKFLLNFVSGSSGGAGSEGWNKAGTYGYIRATKNAQAPVVAWVDLVANLHSIIGSTGVSYAQIF